MNNNDIDILFVSDYYDIPIAGICKHNKSIHKFNYDYATEQYIYTPIKTLEKIILLSKKKFFELCVGYHCSYKNGQPIKGFYYRHPIKLHKILLSFYYWVVRGTYTKFF